MHERLACMSGRCVQLFSIEPDLPSNGLSGKFFSLRVNPKRSLFIANQERRGATSTTCMCGFAPKRTLGVQVQSDAMRCIGRILRQVAPTKYARDVPEYTPIPEESADENAR